MFISRHKYEVEKLVAKQRIEHLEHIICPNGHDYEPIGSKAVATSMYGDLVHTTYVCTRCGKLEEGV